MSKTINDFYIHGVSCMYLSLAKCTWTNKQ